ncbi:MAG: DUF2190 family protein [Nanoarchaeota archaeon]|nr:DUF2190 family protein [Nanoarchaeota archaeon]
MAGFGATAVGGAIDIVFDGGVPRSFSARAREVISGGQFVVVSGAQAVVGSTIAEYIPGSIVVTLIKDTDFANGIALHNVGSNEVVAVATRGTYITVSADAISGGAAVYAFNTLPHAVKKAPINENYSGTIIGRAITAAGSEEFLLVDFSF